MIRNPFFSVLNLLGELILYSAGHLRWGFGQKNFKLAGYGMADGIADKTGGYKLEIIKKILWIIGNYPAPIFRIRNSLSLNRRFNLSSLIFCCHVSPWTHRRQHTARTFLSPVSDSGSDSLRRTLSVSPSVTTSDRLTRSSVIMLCNVLVLCFSWMASMTFKNQRVETIVQLKYLILFNGHCSKLSTSKSRWLN